MSCDKKNGSGALLNIAAHYPFCDITRKKIKFDYLTSKSIIKKLFKNCDNIFLAHM